MRGKGNLCPDPSAFEFEIKEYKIKDHGEVFRGPVLDHKSITHTDLTKDDLIGDVRSRFSIEGGQGKSTHYHNAAERWQRASVQTNSCRRRTART